jgi:hypothetical protein
MEVAWRNEAVVVQVTGCDCRVVLCCVERVVACE